MFEPLDLTPWDYLEPDVLKEMVLDAQKHLYRKVPDCWAYVPGTNGHRACSLYFNHQGPHISGLAKGMQVYPRFVTATDKFDSQAVIDYVFIWRKLCT